eukprot:4514343-Pyramimonas_sp.AAC.1
MHHLRLMMQIQLSDSGRAGCAHPVVPGTQPNTSAQHWRNAHSVDYLDGSLPSSSMANPTVALLQGLGCG